MIKASSRALGLGIALAGAGWIVGCASNPAPRTAPPVAAAPAGCVHLTGSAVPGECQGFGHTWTSSDIEHTGRTTLADSLRDLDPTITISH